MKIFQDLPEFLSESLTYLYSFHPTFIALVGVIQLKIEFQMKIEKTPHSQFPLKMIFFLWCCCQLLSRSQKPQNYYFTMMFLTSIQNLIDGIISLHTFFSCKIYYNVSNHWMINFRKKKDSCSDFHQAISGNGSVHLLIRPLVYVQEVVWYKSWSSLT